SARSARLLAGARGEGLPAGFPPCGRRLGALLIAWSLAGRPASQASRCNNGRMEQRRWLDSSQPQTLQLASLLQYFNAAIALLFVLIGAYPAWFLLLVAEGPAAFGMANDRRWGYYLAVGASVLYLLVSLVAMLSGQGASILTLIFSVALVALLLHPMSRSYQRIWYH
ncbi:MAG: hypothetical protein M0035_05800, partial [Actinomycetota bacterium]|nr:hypothetical protein [Actinomycetota bacterium]